MVSSVSSLFVLINLFLAINCHDQLLVDQLRWDFLLLEDELWTNILDSRTWEHESIENPKILLIKSFHDFDRRMQAIPDDILYGLEVIQQTRPFLFLFPDLRVIHDLYDKFRRVQNTTLNNIHDDKNVNYQDPNTLISHIVNDVLHDTRNNVNKTILNIFDRLIINKDASVFSELFQLVIDKDFNCKYSDQSQQQVFYNLYNTIALAELKGYIMMQFSYMVQRLDAEELFLVGHHEDPILAYDQFKMRFEDFWIRPELLKIFSTEIWRCDPDKHIKGVTYDELTGLLQGYIENEVDMNSRGTCTENCQKYTLTQNHGCYDSKSEYCQKRKPCGGKILNCRFIESHMTACIAPSWSPRRYEYIKYKSGETFGKETYCHKRTINSWFRWFVHCSYCFCFCDSQGLLSDRYFNLRPVMADVENNRIITGIRIIKKNRIIHLQIQEGKLVPYGYIDQSTVRWVPVDDYKITDTGVQNGEDFYTMDYEKRSLFLDVLEPVEESYIVTGVQFDVIDKKLRLKINVRGFDFRNGTLSKDSYYIYGVNTRQQIDIYDADIPILSPPSTPILPVSDKYLDFTHSSIGKDAAQTTVPFFDTQPVISHPAVPLRGVGIFYKGRRGYGGFVAPNIKTYDFTKHVEKRFPKRAKRIDTTNDIPLSN